MQVVERTVEGTQLACVRGQWLTCAAPAVTHATRLTPMIERVQKIVASHHPVPVDAETVSLVEDVSVGMLTVSKKRKLSMETESADRLSDSEHGLVQGGGEQE